MESDCDPAVGIIGAACDIQCRVRIFFELVQKQLCRAEECDEKGRCGFDRSKTQHTPEG